MTYRERILESNAVKIPKCPMCLGRGGKHALACLIHPDRDRLRIRGSE